MHGRLRVGKETMSSGLVAAVTTISIFACVWIGMALRKLLPPSHLDPDSRDAMKIVAGMITMLAAVVLGLLVSSAKERYDSASAAIVESSARVIMLDGALAAYGPETKALREQLRQKVADSIALLWPEQGKRDSLKAFEKGAPMQQLMLQVGGLMPQTELQRELQKQAMEHCNKILISRWLQIEQAQNGVPLPFIIVLVFWLSMLYMAFGLLAPHNTTVITAVFVGALAPATAMFLVIEMNQPMDGFIRIPSAPMLNALEHLARQ